jgi:hypothetical protein
MCRNAVRCALPRQDEGAVAQQRVEEQPDRPAVHGAVAAQVEAGETDGSLDPVIGGAGQIGRHAQHVAAIRQIEAPAGRRMPFVGVVRGQQYADLLQ